MEYLLTSFMHSPAFFLLIQGDDTMTGDGGEYLRAEDLRELGDDSLPGQYLDGMNYLRFSLEGGRTDRYTSNVVCRFKLGHIKLTKVSLEIRK